MIRATIGIISIGGLNGKLAGTSPSQEASREAAIDWLLKPNWPIPSAPFLEK
jgi:hypothetical protein